MHLIEADKKVKASRFFLVYVSLTFELDSRAIIDITLSRNQNS